MCSFGVSAIFLLLANSLHSITAHSIAVCLTGQASRLELESKIKNFVLPNVDRGHKIHLFISMYKSSDHRVNKFNTDATTVPSPNMKINGRGNVDIDFLGASIIKKKKDEPKLLYNVTQFDARFEDSTYEITLDLHLNRMSFSSLDKKLAKLGADPGKKIDPIIRETLHMSQWVNTRRCMQLVEQQEVAQKVLFDVVVRLRDDAFVFQPMLIPDDSVNYLTTSKCFTWGGINDVIYIIGRKWASAFLRSFSEEYYLSHKNLNPGRNSFNGNPEHWALFHALKYQIPHRQVSMCEMPAFPLIRTQGGLLPKRSHVDGLCAVSRACQANNSKFLELDFIDFGPAAGFCFPDKAPTCPVLENRVFTFFLNNSAIGKRIGKEDLIKELYSPISKRRKRKKVSD